MYSREANLKTHQRSDFMNRLIEFIRMGCVCGRESVNIEGRRFYIRSRLGEGYVAMSGCLIKLKGVDRWMMNFARKVTDRSRSSLLDRGSVLQLQNTIPVSYSKPDVLASASEQFFHKCVVDAKKSKNVKK